MKIISWNINGIRAALNKGLKQFMAEYTPDVLCMQEIKISDDARAKTEFDFSEYQEYWHSAQRPGYSGTALLVKSVTEVAYLKPFSWDDEGRMQTIDLGKFYLVNIYFPNANHELSRLDFKLDFNDKILEHVKMLEKKKPVLICGDFNVAHKPIDLARPKENFGTAGYTPEEIAWMDKLVKAGFIDTFRYFHKDRVQYSWWSYRFNARAKNVGWRIDYFCASKGMMKYVKDAFILDQVYGSDHAPVGVKIKLT